MNKLTLRMDVISEKIKTILDQECYELWQAKRCQRHDDNLKFIHTPCWLCNRNQALVQKIVDTIDEGIVTSYFEVG